MMDLRTVQRDVIDSHFLNHAKEWIRKTKSGNWAAASDLESNLGEK